LRTLKDKDTSLIIVSNEVGMGVVPPYPAGRIHRDVLGRANQYLAREADRVYLLLAGIPVELKTLKPASKDDGFDEGVG
jgi:adenosylcobinamide kinase/adenosylcobinamide-phosphate guanylyltransferase